MNTIVENVLRLPRTVIGLKNKQQEQPCKKTINYILMFGPS